MNSLPSLNQVMPEMTRLTNLRSTAATTVCGAFRAPPLAVCIVGDVVSVDALHVMRDHVIQSLGGNATTVFTRLHLLHDHQGRHVRAWQRLVNARSRVVSRVSSESPSQLIGLESLITRELSGHIWCAEQVALAEEQLRQPFASVLYLPSDQLWIAPMHPFCFHATSQRVDRYHGRVWWTTRANLDSVLMRPSAPELRRVHEANGSLTANDINAEVQAVVISETAFAAALASSALRHGATPSQDSSLVRSLISHSHLTCSHPTQPASPNRHATLDTSPRPRTTGGFPACRRL